MNVLHTTWFWLLIILGPVFTVLGILARLARKEPNAAHKKCSHCTPADDAVLQKPRSSPHI
jgi:hypothetical protein